MRHPTMNAAFTGVPEVRQLFARNGEGEVEYLEDRAAPEFKERRAAGEVFSCVVPTCSEPLLTVVDRKERRHGFAHLSGGGHPGMGLAHLQSQLLIQRWVWETYPGLHVELEMATEDGSRRADVMVTSPVSGQQIAFEVQYASMTPEDWTMRHQSYQEQGIVDIWLWGYGGAHVRPDTSSPGRVNGSPTLATACQAGVPQLLIDPDREALGYASREPRRYMLPTVRVLSPDGAGEVHAEPLRAFRLNSQRKLTSDGLEALHAASAQVRAYEARLAEEERHRQAAEDAAEAQRARNVEQFFTRVDAKAANAERKWVGSAEHKRILAMFSVVPAVLSHQPVSGNTPIRLPIPPPVWQSHLYLRHIHGLASGRWISVRRMSEELAGMDPDIRFAEEAVRSWLGALAERGVVRKAPSQYSYDRWPKFFAGEPLATGELRDDA